MTWSVNVLNEFLGPGFGEFSSAEIPDLRSEFDQAPHWLANHFLNSVLRARYRHGFRQLALGYLRRVTRGFDAYHRARDLTATFLDARARGQQPVRQYYGAVDAWEEFALQSAMALQLFRHLNDGEGAFRKNDGSPEERVYTIANQIKHTASCIQSGQCSDKDMLPLWLSNRGLESFGVTVTFQEAANVLADLSKAADELQDPLAFSEGGT